MKVSAILTPNPQCVGPEATLAVAAQKMKSLGIGMLPICENDKLVGTLTDRDITIRAVASGNPPNSTKVRQAMTREVVYCFDDENIEVAAQLMEQKQIRRLPVLSRNKRLIGIISLGDLAVRTQGVEFAGKVLEQVSIPVAFIE